VEVACGGTGGGARGVGRPSEGKAVCVARGGCREVEVWQRSVQLATEASHGCGVCGGVAGRPHRAIALGSEALGESPMAAASSVVALSVGVPCWSYTSSASWSLGENPVLLGRATAASLTSCPPWRRCLLRPALAAMPPVTITVAPTASSTRSCDGLAGGCPLTAEEAACLLVARGRLLAFVSSTCSGPRRLALMRSPVQYGTASFDGACGDNSGRRLDLQRIVAGCSSMPEASRCGTTSTDGACDILGLLARRQLLLVRGSNERNSVYNGGFGVDLSMGCGAL
jgi:hypothetical protein